MYDLVPRNPVEMMVWVITPAVDVAIAPAVGALLYTTEPESFVPGVGAENAIPDSPEVDIGKGERV